MYKQGVCGPLSSVAPFPIRIVVLVAVALIIAYVILERIWKRFIKPWIRLEEPEFERQLFESMVERKKPRVRLSYACPHRDPRSYRDSCASVAWKGGNNGWQVRVVSAVYNYSGEWSVQKAQLDAR